MENNQTIEEIKEKYKYIETLNDKTLVRMNGTFYAKLKCSFIKYNFKERIAKLQKNLQDNYNNFDKKDFYIYLDKLNELENEITKLDKQLFTDFKNSYDFILSVSRNYTINKDVTGALKIYENIFKEILDNQVKNIITHEKEFILLNDHINDLIHKLNFNIC